MTFQMDSVPDAATARPGDVPLAADVSRRIRVHPDFPVPGVAFQDLCPVFADPALLARIADAVAARFAGRFDTVLAIEARGFVLGTALARSAGCALTLARKPGKLPGPVHRVDYQLEYGTAALEIQRDAGVGTPRVLIIDDVLATGGTVAAAAELVGLVGGEVAGCAWVLAIAALDGLARLASFDTFALLSV